MTDDAIQLECQLREKDGQIEALSARVAALEECCDAWQAEAQRQRGRADRLARALLAQRTITESVADDLRITKPREGNHGII